MDSLQENRPTFAAVADSGIVSRSEANEKERCIRLHPIDDNPDSSFSKFVSNAGCRLVPVCPTTSTFAPTKLKLRVLL
jgi:hypothetical protein